MMPLLQCTVLELHKRVVFELVIQMNARWAFLEREVGTFIRSMLISILLRISYLSLVFLTPPSKDTLLS